MMSVSKHKKAFKIFAMMVIVTGTSSMLAKGRKTFPYQSAEKEIVFISAKWKEVLVRAKKEGKYIFVDAYTDWCVPCRQLKSVTFKDAGAAAYYNAKFINYTVDMEKGEGTKLAEYWNVTAYPTLLYFTPEGKMIMKQTGYIDGNRLLELGKQAVNRK